MRYYVVADVHGFYTELIAALTEKGYFEDEAPHKLILCGDLFDRGKEGLKLQSFLLELMERDEVIIIRGNHEDLAEEFVRNVDHWMTPTLTYTHHWQNGTVQTVLDLTGMGISEAYTNPKKCALRMNETPFFKKILPSAVDYYETEHYIFVHGWIPCYEVKYASGNRYYTPKENWREGTEEDWTYARWYNGMDAAWQGVTEPNKTIVCGHWHCSYGHAVIEGKGEERGENADYTPYYGKGVIGLDACTARSGRVNCIVLED